jgi:glycosyltransferase involved in cell wall biosynthesis
VDNQFFVRGAQSARKDAAVARRKFALPERYFLGSARFTEKKNLPFLLRAFARYRRQVSGSNSPWDLVLIGDGPLRSTLIELRSELGVNESIHLAGAKPYQELPAFYGLASAFVHASTTEQWGLVTNEALACGLPVLISRRCGCAEDLVRENHNGFTFDPFNIEELAEKMTKVAAPDFPLERFASASSEMISHWTPAMFAENLLQAIKAALASPRRRATAMDRALLWGLLHT